ncbi:MAG: hypothetical protein AB7F98_09930 [Novosphingobium sp.]
MQKFKNIAMGLVVPSLIFAVTAQAGITRASDAEAVPYSPAPACNVQVFRNAAPGVFDVHRENLQDGSCVCTARTGPASQGGSAEAALAALLQSHQCGGAPVAGNGYGASRGGGFGTSPLLMGSLAAGGLTAGFTKGGRSN